MAQQPFPWTTDFAEKTNPSTSDSSRPQKLAKIPTWARKAGPYALFAAALFALFANRGAGGKDSSQPTFSSVNTLAVMTPIAKGSRIWAETLKEIPIDRSSFTKAQLIQLIGAQDLERLNGKIRAKKDLPPNKPLFWSDIDFTPLKEGTEVPSIKIVFPQEASK